MAARDGSKSGALNTCRATGAWTSSSLDARLGKIDCREPRSALNALTKKHRRSAKTNRRSAKHKGRPGDETLLFRYRPHVSWLSGAGRVYVRGGACSGQRWHGRANLRAND